MTSIHGGTGAARLVVQQVHHWRITSGFPRGLSAAGKGGVERRRGGQAGSAGGPNGTKAFAAAGMLPAGTGRRRSGVGRARLARGAEGNASGRSRGGRVLKKEILKLNQMHRRRNY